MKQIADLHIHSKYSRACSKQLELENIESACRIKGVDIVATGDFTHPAWFGDISSKLEEIENSGLYRLKSAPDSKIKFVLSTEVALIYKALDKVRRLHIMVMAPNLKLAKEFNDHLSKSGYNIKSDGRPILGMSAQKLCEICFNISSDFVIFPAHIWTPWFAVFGSKSGFDSLEECFEEQVNKIHAIETGLSSDPEMNWALSGLDDIVLLSNSDAHSLINIAREANIFDLQDVSYGGIREAMNKKNRGKNLLLSTIEFYPEEGMYHFDGHRACNVSFTPEETKKYSGICPVCKRPLTIGVMSRVKELADREFGFKPKNAAPFVKLVELDKIIAETMNIKSRASKAVLAEYNNLIKLGGNELNILLNLNYDELKKIASEKITEAIKRVREGNLIIEPGFDGEYGKVKIFSEKEKTRQKKLF
ncbi:DNA helicase UvrD [Candidatus Parcubacteria bacterium]|nr:DNA helicase UvrD [Candidatus Parcubacteria bacterium]